MFIESAVATYKPEQYYFLILFILQNRKKGKINVQMYQCAVKKRKYKRADIHFQTIISFLNFHFPTFPTLPMFTTLNLFLPRQHSTLQIFSIGKSHHFQNLTCLTASVTTAAI